MDQMRITSTEPSSVILSQTKKFKRVDKGYPKIPIQAEAKRDGVINPQNFNQFLTRKILMLSIR